jgi:ABC-type transporter Mla subunit MlaD
MQDLTPQIRTRLNRVERSVGWFVFLAVALLVAGFCYYLYTQAQRRGWFEIKAPYYTYSDSGEGLAVGDAVKLMGFEVGHITGILAMPPRGRGSDHNVKIEFEVVGTNYNYIWTNSTARLTDSGFLGKRAMDISKGTQGYNVYMIYPLKDRALERITDLPQFDKLRLGEELYEGTNLVLRAWLPLSTNMAKISGLGLSKLWIIDTSRPGKKITGVWDDKQHRYTPFEGTNVYMLTPEEPPALMDRLQGLVTQVEEALPNFLKLTNQIAATLSNSEQLTSNLNLVAANTRPIVGNLAVITAQLKDPHGSLGEWLIPTNLNQQLGLALLNANGALTNVNNTVTNVNTNLVAVFEDLGRSLENLAGITSNLNRQVQANSNMLSQISDIVVHSDQFVQGLKRHWLLRSAFKEHKTKAPPKRQPQGGHEPVSN